MRTVGPIWWCSVTRPLQAIALISALAFGLEFGTRVDEFVRWGTPLRSGASSINDIIAVDSLGAHGIAGAQYRQFSFNADGVRGPALTADRARILVIGASETFGLYEPAGKEYPRQLEDSLRVRGCVVDVVNAALPGFSLPTLTVTFVNRLRALHAALAIVYPAPVQYLESERPAFHAPRTPAPAKSLLSSLRIVRRLRDHLKSILPERTKTYLRTREIAAQRLSSPDAQWTTVPADRRAAYSHDLGTLLDTLTSSGMRVVVATHANAFQTSAPMDTGRLIAWAKFYPKAAMALLPEFDRTANADVAQLAASRGAVVSDLPSTLRRFDVDSVFADFSHFTAFGAAKVAGQLSHDILSHYGCPATPVRQRGG